MKNLLAIAAVLALTACGIAPDASTQAIPEMQPDDVVNGEVTNGTKRDVQVERVVRDFPTERFASVSIGSSKWIMLDRTSGCVYRDDGNRMEPILNRFGQPDCRYRKDAE